jgi:hypothetical protein
MPFRRLAATVLAAAALCHAAPAAAQPRVQLAPGTPVRLGLAVDPYRVQGRMLRTDGGGTTVVIWARGPTVEKEVRYDVKDLVSLETSTGRKRLRGTLVGAAIGAALSAVVGGIDTARGEMSSAELAESVASCALAGGMLGYAFAPRDWRPLPLPNARRR